MSLRIVHTGDAHVDAATHGGGIDVDTGAYRAVASHLTALKSVVQGAISEGVDAFIHAGDGWKDGRPSPHAIGAFADCLRPLAGAGIPVILIGGNHDLMGVPPQQDTANAVVAELLQGWGATVCLAQREPTLFRLPSGLQVVALPWMSKSVLLTAAGADAGLSPIEGDRLMARYAIDRCAELAAQAEPGAPIVLAGHATVEGVGLGDHARRGSEQDITHVFNEPILPLQAVEDLPVAAALMSHIHQPQQVGKNVFYAGSPDRLTLTDATDDKTYNLVELDSRGRLVGVRRVPTVHRAMARVDLTDPGAATQLEALQPGCLVGLVLPPGVALPPTEAVNAIKAAGAQLVAVKRAPVAALPATTVTLPEQVTPLAALRDWLATKKLPGVDPERVIALASNLIEGGHQR